MDTLFLLPSRKTLGQSPKSANAIAHGLNPDCVIAIILQMLGFPEMTCKHHSNLCE